MAKLNEAVELLLASLEKAQSELEWVANRLEDEFGSRCKGGQINAFDVLARIHRLRRELPAVADECAAMLQAKQECVDAAKRHLLANTELLRQLQRRAGLPALAAGSNETQAAFEAALAEHEEKLRRRLNGDPDRAARAQLNEAYAHSVVS